MNWPRKWFIEYPLSLGICVVAAGFMVVLVLGTIKFIALVLNWVGL